VPVKMWDTITESEASDLFQADIDRHSNYKKLITSPLSSDQEAALASFEFNLWPNIWDWDAKWIIDMVNSWDLEWAWELMKKFNTAGWEFVQGLQNRRNEEAGLLMKTQSTEEQETPGFSEQRLARNAAIDLFIWGTELKKTTKQRTAANQELVDEFGVQIEDFRTENKWMVDIFNRVVAWATSKTSDKEQVMNFNKAIAESALWDGSTQPMKNKIRATLLDDNVISEKLETAKDTTEVIWVIQDLFDNVTKETWVTTKGLETIARTIGKTTWDEITSIDQITGKMLAAYVKSISGAAVTDQEFERLATQMPSLKDNPERFQLMLTNFKDETVRANTVKARQLLNDDNLFNELFPELSKEKKKEETGSAFRNRWRSPEVTNTTPSNNLKFNINK
jgi:GH24 family phage-related lysozyme (muramidase)